MTLVRLAKLTIGAWALATATLVPVGAHAATTYYVAPTGSDSAAGTEAAPFASMAKGQSVATAGDTVLFKGGTYSYDRGTTTCSSGTATISGVVLSKSGTAGNLIKYWAAPGEKPVFDFSGILDSCRIKGILVSASYVHVKGLEIKGVRQNNDLNHESWGVWIQGSNNIFEQLDIHHIMGAGLFIQQGGQNLVLNCDSHHNLDEHTSNGAGESADGFGCHIRAGDAGNVFRGCRAWWNADDGYDFINAFDACTVEGSWAWYNGYRPDTMTGIGNGNGFKGGGYGADATKFPANPARHTIRNCLAFNNRAAGFYANHHPNSCYFYNNTGYGNSPNFNMLGMSSSGADTTVGVYRNNISFTGSLYSNRNSADETFNSWTVAGITLAAADFQSVATTGLDAPRRADGGLPDLPNFHLAAGSDLIDKGTDVGLPFAGSAPDLGCFETGLATAGTTSSGGATGSAGATSGGNGSAGNAGSGSIAGAAGSGGPGAAAGTGSGTAGAATTGGGGPGMAAGGASTMSAGTSMMSAGTSSDPVNTATPDDPAGCACSVPGSLTANGQGGVWLVVALGALAGRRRRAA